MLDFQELWRCLADLDLESWREHLQPLIVERLQDDAHGDFGRWRQTLGELQAVGTGDPQRLRRLLLSLAPWRKGPFDIAGIRIDAEWRSDIKWKRLRSRIAPLQDRAVLDVGCGNGYYALQMHAAGARAVIGIDPTLLYVLQFLAVEHFLPAASVFVLPLRLHELPRPAHAFDTTFSMGVLYHQRSPLEHLRQLRQTLRPGGQLVIETIFMPGEESCACTPTGRYARMRNVWLLPTIRELTTWLLRSGFRDVEIVDQSVTTTEEQRSTEWMTFESLREALNPDDPERTVEGWPAPRRVVAVANAP
ncbi:MAG: tRNA 5-methoxyuridine(34)/uridine 5-oxyacetic acid(34) synthase CmoB [Gammaproteobacteria bacterium]|nr:tRNA 5-methoxyuridine(34)/uridine 5-oxyacetic acid(34) synthase CmoB [Gammaproteobacteria bacterium]